MEAWVSFKLPEGGMSVWTQFNADIDLRKLARQALMHELYFYDGASFNADEKFNATRLGFASSTPEELQKSVEIIHRLLKR